MKLYHFRKIKYGTEYTVMAKSQKAALLFLKQHCEKTCIPYINNMEDYNYFANGRGSIVEYGEGHVLETEVC